MQNQNKTFLIQRIVSPEPFSNDQQQQPIFPDPNSRLPRTGQWTSRMFCCRFFGLWKVTITTVFDEIGFIWGNASLVDNITINAHNSGTLQPPVLVREFVLVRSISYKPISYNCATIDFPHWSHYWYLHNI